MYSSSGGGGGSIKESGATYDHIWRLGSVTDGGGRSLQGHGGSGGGGAALWVGGWRDSASRHHQLDEPPSLLQDAYGLLVRDVAVQRLPVDRQDLVALLKAPISAKRESIKQMK